MIALSQVTVCWLPCPNSMSFPPLRPMFAANVEPMTQPYPLVNVLRPDVEQPCLDRDEVLAVAPAAEDGRFRVPPSGGLHE